MRYRYHNGTYYATDASSPAGATLVDVPTDKYGLMEYLNSLGVKKEEAYAPPVSSPRDILARNDWEEKLRAIEPERLSEEDGDKAIDIIGKYGRMPFSDRMKNLVDVLFKKTHRLGDFKNYEG